MEVSILNGYKIKDKKAIRFYDTVQDMKEDDTLKEGMHVKTKGYYSSNDGGASEYHITATESNSDYQEELESGLYATLIVHDEINSLQLGINSNSEEDMSVVLNNFFNINTNKYVLKKGTYNIDGDISINSDSYIFFEEGAIIQRITTTDDTYFMLDLDNCSNVIIENAHLIGDRDTHTGTGEWGYGINVGCSSNVVIRNCIIEKTWGDGIYIGYKYSSSNLAPCNNILVENCKVLSCSRNGYAICAGTYITLNNCYSYKNDRTSPKAGLDIESEAPNEDLLVLDHIKINNFTSEDNTVGIALNVKKPFNEISINNHNAISDKYGFIVYKFDEYGNIIYENANIIKSRINAILINKKNKGLLTIRDININGRTISDYTHGSQGAIQINTSSVNDGNLIIDNIKLNNTFSDTYLYEDIICETGTGTFSNLKLYNIFTTRYLCLNNIDNSTFEFNNCEFIGKSAAATQTNNKNTIFNLMRIRETLIADATRNIMANLPDGNYKIILLNNFSNYNFNVVFENTLIVYKSGESTSESNRTFTTNVKCNSMEFEKVGNYIFIINTGLSNASV